MRDPHVKKLLATVEFPAEIPIEVLASRLTERIRGFVFTRDETGRFEEVPAFIAESNGITFVLFGVPEGEPNDGCVLEFSTQTCLGINEFRNQAPEFVRGFVTEKNPDSRGYIDCSDALAETLSDSGFFGCKAVSP